MVDPLAKRKLKPLFFTLTDESVKETFASQLHKVLWYFFTACDCVGDENDPLLAEDPEQDPVFTVTSLGVQAVKRPDTAFDDYSNERKLHSAVPSGSTGSSASTYLSSEDSLGGMQRSRDMSTPLSSVSCHPGSADSQQMGESSDSKQDSGGGVDGGVGRGNVQKTGDVDTGGVHSILQRPVIPIDTFTPLIGTLLLSQNSLVADPARAAVVAILAKLRKAPSPVYEDWTEERPENVRLSYQTQTGVHDHEFPVFSVPARRIVMKELFENIVLGIGRLHGDREELHQTEGEDVEHGSGHTKRARSISRASDISSASVEGLDSAVDEANYMRQQLIQEAVLGRAISMNLIASISEFMKPHEVDRYDLITEVARTLDDEPGVKAESALALAGLAKLAPKDYLEDIVSVFCSDLSLLTPADQKLIGSCLFPHSSSSLSISPMMK